MLMMKDSALMSKRAMVNNENLARDKQLMFLNEPSDFKSSSVKFYEIDKNQPRLTHPAK